jgi:shikimate kinase
VTAPRLSDSDPLTVTSAAAMWPGSRSRPTTAAWEEERFLNTCVISAGGGAILRAQEEALISRNVFCTMAAVPNALRLLKTFGSQTRLTLLEPA